MFFPGTSFRLLLPGGVVRAGERLESTLVVRVPGQIPNAYRIEIEFRTTVTGQQRRSGKLHSISRTETLFADTMALDLPFGEGLAAGEHRFSMAFDVPPWLPPAHAGDGFSIEHAFAARVCVQFGFDLTEKFAARVLPMPTVATGSAVVFRSPTSFHRSIVLELALDADVATAVFPPRGQVALRGGLDVSFESLELALESAVTSSLFDGARTSAVAEISIPAAALRGGAAVRFTFPPSAHVVPTYETTSIAHGCFVIARVVGMRGPQPTMAIPVRVLAEGSTLRSDGSLPPAVVGRSRVERHAAAMVQATGLRPGELPLLVEGTVGSVRISIHDAPRDGMLGVRGHLEWPPLELGFRLSRKSLLDRLRTSVPLPAPLDEHYVLRRTPPDDVAYLDDRALKELILAFVGELRADDDVVLGDDELGIQRTLAEDTTHEAAAIATEMNSRAARIAAAIENLPFAGDELERAAWRATATECGAALVPHVPALHGVPFRARVTAGEMRTLLASIRTRTEGDIRSVAVTLDLREVPLPDAAVALLEAPVTEGPRELVPVFAVLPNVVVVDAKTIRLESPVWPRDPRKLLPAIETLFDWILDARGERKIAAPYR